MTWSYHARTTGSGRISGPQSWQPEDGMKVDSGDCVGGESDCSGDFLSELFYYGFKVQQLSSHKDLDLHNKFCVHALCFDGNLALRQAPTPREQVLDLGTGTGIWAENYNQFTASSVAPIAEHL